MPAARTQVGIVGAGPAGLLVSQLLARAGIESVILERATRERVEGRVRAGVLEPGTCDVLEAAGVGARLRREGLVHDGVELRFAGQRHRVDFAALTGRSMTIYGQQEVVKDLVRARQEGGGNLVFEAEDVRLEEIAGKAPVIRYRHGGRDHDLCCDFIAGCDGSHGACRGAIPEGAVTEYSRAYPFAWLGILAAAAPTSPVLVYARHERGFALYSMRSPAVTRLYLQCRPDEELAQWSDARLWEELHLRLEGADGWRLNEGAITQRMIAPIRSSVLEPMGHGRLYLAGDAAHIVPPTGAKGLNLAVNDARLLAEAIEAHYAGDPSLLATYSERCLERVWRAEHFSWWMTSMLHRFEDADGFDRRLQLAQLEGLVASRAAQTALAESYLGLSLRGEATA